LLDGDVLVEQTGEVGDRPGGDRHPQGRAVQAALHGLEHQRRGAGGAGRGGHDVDRGGPGPAQVLVRTVHQGLVAGVGVDRVHQALLHAEGVVEDLDERNEAVGGAGRVRHDDVLLGIERVVVDADHERGVHAAGRGGDDHAGRSTIEVGSGLVAVGEDAGRLDDHVDAQVTPGDLRRVAVLDDLEDVAVDVDAAVDLLDGARVGAGDRVPLEQQGHLVERTQVVDGDEVDVGAPGLGRPE